MSIDYAREHGFGLVIEGVFRVPEMTVSTAEKCAAADYQVEVVGLGVRAERSRLDCLHLRRHGAERDHDRGHGPTA
ncbi:zeta toxin family protein [Streptomyces lavendulocolor]|uniref:zeta toxin family protein n=1 Tax=Streptomyces lavendulocolor TaxID=67316 RepID=UPI003C2C88B8